MQVRKFEVWVREEDKRPKTEIVNAFSPQELMAQYEAMGLETRGPKAQVKILKEFPPEKIADQNQNAAGVMSDTGSIPLLDVGDLREDVAKAVVADDKPIIQPAPLMDNPVHANFEPTPAPVVTAPVVPAMKWKDGETEFKLENGKLSKKQWVGYELSDLEDQGYQIEVTGDGSYSLHIKREEWVEVEQT